MQDFSYSPYREYVYSVAIYQCKTFLIAHIENTCIVLLYINARLLL